MSPKFKNGLFQIERMPCPFYKYSSEIVQHDAVLHIIILLADTLFVTEIFARICINIIFLWG